MIHLCAVHTELLSYWSMPMKVLERVLEKKMLGVN